ncbi:MAG: hypothetical protein ABJA78_14440 [Ferruginibacter sp.]
MHYLIAAFLLFSACQQQSKKNNIPDRSISSDEFKIHSPEFDSSFKTIHVFVALCDNKYQGIVPVPAAIGNGQDPDNNLYWGCGFGVRTYFSKSNQWTLIRKQKIDSIKMERLIFKHKTKNYYLIADAYNGKYIKQATIDFLQSCAGMMKDTIRINNKTIGIYGNAKLIAFVGHDGLMDFNLTNTYKNADGKRRDAIILACISKKYFSQHLQPTGARALVWSNGLMSPEAYTLHDAIATYMNDGNAEQVRNSAAEAYAKFQHCSKKAALGLLVSE